jgi:16S rRNA (guanine966-N2)-methyltransferase
MKKGRRQGTVRIIGGKWRGRRLPVPDLPGLRPSGDRSRETLFNWLQARIHGLRCLDLFAGTGALGLEAASRGAAEVVLVESSGAAARAIRENIKALAAENVRVVEGDAIAWLESAGPGTTDLALIDPPFDSGLEHRAIELLTQRECVPTGGMLYVETRRSALPPSLGAGWRQLREKELGEVRMQLFEKTEG